MFRLIASVCLAIGLFVPFGAQGGEDVCVACEGPEATYRCTPELPVKSTNSDLGAVAGAKLCTTVLAQSANHKKCRAIKDGAPCTGPERVVTLTDYQRMIAGDGQPSTYQPGAFEIARENVQDTLRCVTSLFGDC